MLRETLSFIHCQSIPNCPPPFILNLANRESRTRPSPCASAGGYSAGLHRLDEDNLHWTDVTAAAAAATAAAAGPNASMPAARQHPGFAAAGDGKLYLYGGMGAEGVFLRRFARLSPRE